MSKKKTEDLYLSGVLKQYDEMRTKHPDAVVLFRTGDFYELVREDAVKAADLLNLTVTKRQVNGNSVEFTGFPHHALDTYLPKLVRSGNRVAIFEQLEDPRVKKYRESIEEPSEAKRKSSKKSASKEGNEGKVKMTDNEKNLDKKGDKTIAQKPEPEVVVAAHRREPQMVTVNGQAVTHAHAYQGNVNPNNWYFTAKLDGISLKPQLMQPEDVAKYANKDFTIPQMMEKYFPTKLMEKVPDVAFSIPNVIAGPEGGTISIDRFNVYKEKNPARDDFGKYKFFASVDGKNMSVVASKEDLNKFFDRVTTPADLVKKNFGERLHLPEAYAKYILPEGIKSEDIRISKGKDGTWGVSVDLGDSGKTSRAILSYDDGYSYFQTHTASREQIAAKYLGNEIKEKLNESVVNKQALKR